MLSGVIYQVNAPQVQFWYSGRNKKVQSWNNLVSVLSLYLFSGI